ncbi:MAG: SHOCT domain-containing protein [Pseudomonadota bacterium]
MKFKKRDKEGIFKSLFAAYFVILLHVFLLAGTGITVVLFRGVYHYLPWIMSGLAVLILLLFWIFYMRMKKSSSDMREMLSFPEFRDRRIEIRLLGGLASFTIDGKPESLPVIGYDERGRPEGGLLRLENSDAAIERRIRELASLYESDLITKEEFDVAKQKILYE